MPDTSDELDNILLAVEASGRIKAGELVSDTHGEWIALDPVEAKKLIRKAIRAEMLSMIGEHETEYSNLDGDAGYWEKHGRNQFRDKLRQQVIRRYGAEDGGREE